MLHQSDALESVSGLFRLAVQKRVCLFEERWDVDDDVEQEFGRLGFGGSIRLPGFLAEDAGFTPAAGVENLAMVRVISTRE